MPRYQTIDNTAGHDPIHIERVNLLNVTKLIVKELIESSLKHGRMLDSDHVPLQHFFIVLEHVMRHGLKPKKGLLGPKKELWNVLETIEKYVVDAQDITASVRQLPTVRTPVGRSRAWLRLALMQKKLADYFKCLLDRRDNILSEFYEENSMMMSEEAIVIGGLLVGLNVIDCNLCVKEENLDSLQGIIDFSLYLRDSNSDTVVQDGVDSSNMTTVLDQKNYIEELNRHLNATVTNLQAKVENLTTTNALMKEDMAIAKNQILQLQEANVSLLQQQIAYEQQSTNGKMSVDSDGCETTDVESVRTEMKNKLLEEMQQRIVVERDLQQRTTVNMELETAVKLLEKDVHEKQDTIISLRRQLEDIKMINLEMFKKLQECETTLKQKSDTVAKLEEKVAQMNDRMQQLEAKNTELEKAKVSAEERARKLAQQITEKDSKRSALETDLKIEREWRTSLQETIISDKDRIANMQVELARLKTIAQDYEALKDKNSQLLRQSNENQQTLEELATHLGEYKVKVDDLKEASRSQKDAVWLSDKEASACRQCGKEFSVARRKHHCRNCGEIFCHSCSDNTMPLPSSAKPVRVCDNCHTVLLERYLTS